MIQTYSAFYYGHMVDETNFYLNFKEGAGPEITAQLNVGSYTATDFAIELSRAMNAIGTQTYTVTFDRSTRLITISAPSNFQLLLTSGTNVGNSVFSLVGFSGADTALALTHTGNAVSGSAWCPQMRGQDFVDFEDQQSSIDGVVKKSSNGTVEVAKFGTQKIMDINFMFITDIHQENDCWIKSDASGVANARTFLEYATTKADLEFIPDVDNPDVFNKCLLESTDSSRDGLGFKLNEMYTKGLPGYYSTGVMKFRLIE